MTQLSNAMDENNGLITTEALSKMSSDKLVEMLLTYKNRHDTLAEEFDDYKTSSIEMEQMLEKDLEDATRKLGNAVAERDAAKRELERTTRRHDSEKKEVVRIEEALRQELASIRGQFEAARLRIRTLEQANDDLERRERNQQQILEDLSRDLNMMTEKAAILESDLAETHFMAESSAKSREEQRNERPLMAVEPLRVDRLEHRTGSGACEDHVRVALPSPILPSPPPSSSTQSNKLTAEPVAIQPTESCSSQLTSKTTSTEKTSARGTFTHSINQIVKDLLGRVDRVEQILTTIRSTPAAP